jgi:hypothetical protein
MGGVGPRSGEQDADRLGDGDFPREESEATTGGIDPERDDRIRALMGADKPRAVGGKIKIARLHAAAVHRFDPSEPAGGRGDRVDDETVVAAFGSVKETTVGMDADLGGGAFAGKVCRQGGQRLNGLKRAYARVVGENRDGVGEFTDDVEKASVG